MVSFALLKPFFTCRTSLCMSPTPSIDTRVLKMTPFLLHSSTILVSIGIARWGVSPGGVDAELAQARQAIQHHLAQLDQIVAGRRLAA